MRGNLRRGLALVRKRTHRGAPVRVTLLEKPECGLCAEAHRQLRRIALDRPLDIERVDISADPALLDRYTLRIPVIRAGGTELDSAGQSDATIARWLRQVAPE
ncbi:MAG: glutaredoxin family protein [Chloroflexota bacterium]|nr:glutaredoxin family protein [Chloroflexota bacterium]